MKIFSQEQDWTENAIRIANIHLILSERAFAHFHCKNREAAVGSFASSHNWNIQWVKSSTGLLVTVEAKNRCLHRRLMELQVRMIFQLLKIRILHIHIHCSSAFPSLLAPISHDNFTQQEITSLNRILPVLMPKFLEWSVFLQYTCERGRCPSSFLLFVLALMSYQSHWKESQK